MTSKIVILILKKVTALVNSYIFFKDIHFHWIGSLSLKKIDPDFNSTLSNNLNQTILSVTFSKCLIFTQ